jgi:two-component system response regulator ChvI
VRVLHVEDDDDFREAFADQLSDLGFTVQGFANGAALLGAINGGVVADVIVLDWKLPGPSGIELLSQLRRRGVNLPVVFLTGHTATDHESRAFESGATDFINKLRGVDILVRRLKRAVEGAKPAGTPLAEQTDKRLVFGRLALRLDISRAYWNGVDVGLTVGEYRIVQLLASNRGQYVTYRAIYDQMHYVGFIAGGGKYGYSTNVRASIKRIRTKFLECDPAFDDIENYISFGYRWRQSNVA